MQDLSSSKKIGIKHWIQAARPKTLLVSIAPVLMSIALSSHHADIKWLPALICLLFALLAQVVSNFINDYSDGVKGSDSQRLGPERMVASGYIPPKKMLRATIIMLIVSFMLGCCLLYWGGWVLLPFGLLILLCAIAYSWGPFPLSYHALGDVAVVLFYGVAPVALTFFIQTGYVDLNIAIAGLAIGIVTDNLLIVNNYRDFSQDAANGKKTTVILFGRDIMRMVYFFNPFVAVALGILFVDVQFYFWLLASVPFLVYSVSVDRKFNKAEGIGFNRLIGLSSLESLIFSLTVVIVLMIF
ncbi:MAG: 1,4-dihydroxy-2-naphthoate octaprenyltransferase [Candidatus Limimorpha sp.]